MKTYGRTWPWSVSLQAPRSDRPIARAAIVLTGTDLGQLETGSVAAILRGAGVDVTLVDDPRLSATEFADLYADPDFDLLWVVGHGVYEHDDPGMSHLPMPDRTRVNVNDLEARRPTTSARRLLVLNLCDAATALIAGGPPEFGLGVRAAGPTQAVIGHRWPVASWPDAPLIGRLLAEDVLSEQTYFQGYSATIQTLIAGVESIRERLTGAGGDLDDRLRVGLANHLEDRPSRLSMWSSLAFLE